MLTGSLPKIQTGYLSVSFLPDSAGRNENLDPWRWRMLCVRYGMGFSSMQQQTVGTILGRQIASAGIQLDEGLLFNESLTSLLSTALYTAAIRLRGTLYIYSEGQGKPDIGVQFLHNFLHDMPINSSVFFAGDSASLCMIDILLGIRAGTASRSLFPQDQTMCMICVGTSSNGDLRVTQIITNPCGAAPITLTPDELKAQLGIS